MDSKRANIIIIGGGVIGASIAFHLADAGHKEILLLDRGPLASGTTPYAAGQTAYLTSHRAALDFSVYCTDFFENFEKRTGYPIDFRQHGSLRIALTKPYMANLNGYLAAASELNEERVRLLTRTEALAMVPGFELAEEPPGILYNGRDGFVDPKSVALGYASGARDRGVQIRTHTTVHELRRSDGRVTGVVASSKENKHEQIDANWVILAAGAWTRQIAQQCGIDIPSVPIRHQAFVTAPSKQVDPTQPIVRVIDSQIYVRPEAGGLLVGGYGYRPISYDMNNFAPNFEIGALEPDAISYDELKSEAARFFPLLHDASIVQERRGLPTVTPDGGMVMSNVAGAQGLVVASGCQVSGVAYSPGIGEVTTALIDGRQSILSPLATQQVQAQDGDKNDSFSLTRFDGAYADDTVLRARCEHIYGSMYWGSSAYTHLEH